MSFARTMRSLDGDGLRGRGTRALVVLGFLAVWTVWATCGRVSLYATTTSTRIESSGEVHAVEAPIGGRAVTVNLALDGMVEAGQVLVVLDSSIAVQRRLQAVSQREALGPKLDAARRELLHEQAAQTLLAQRVDVAVQGAKARASEAQAAAAYGAQASARAQKLQQADVGSAAESDSARAFAAQKRAQAYGAAVDIKRQRLDARLELARSLARIAELERQSADLEGQRNSAAALVEGLDREIDQHVLRAPVAGRLGAISDLQVGAVVQAGNRVASIIPLGQLRAVAQFSAAEAVGRIAPGQSATIRLDGFPWTQFGTLEGRVTSVGSEPRDGKVRVELAIDRATAKDLPLQHGLPGSAEVEVGRVAPFTLLLRGMSQVAPPNAVAAARSDAPAKAASAARKGEP